MTTDPKNKILLSICIPSIPSRFDRLIALMEKLDQQIGSFDDIEVVCVIDNKHRTIGDKRNAVKNLAQGKFFCMIDDDDDVSDLFVSDIRASILYYGDDVDVISFNSLCISDEKKGEIHMSLANKENEQFQPDGVTKRPPWHMCCWKREIFQKCMFDPGMYGEDWTFVERCLMVATTPGLFACFSLRVCF